MSRRRQATVLRAWHAAAAGVSLWVLAPVITGGLVLWALGGSGAIPAFARAHGPATPAVFIVIAWCVGFLTLLVLGSLLSRRRGRP